MAKLIWDETGKRLYETGVRQGVLYPQDAGGAYPLGVAWNGLTTVTESPSGAEATALYADNIKYLNLISAEQFGATIEAYTYPKEFAICDGSAELSAGVAVNQQTRKAFGLAYRTSLGNDVNGADYGYKLHLIYGALAAPSEKAYASINDTPEAITFSWALTTTPVTVTGFKPTASLIIDSTQVDPTKLAVLENIIYGNTGVNPRLPLPDEIATIFASAAPSALALSSSVPADAAVAVVATSNLVLTFNNKVAADDVIVTSQAGVIIPGTKTWDATGTILTFDPTASLTATTPYLIIIGGVTDIYGQSLAASVVTFTTA